MESSNKIFFVRSLLYGAHKNDSINLCICLLPLTHDMHVYLAVISTKRKKKRVITTTFLVVEPHYK